MPFGTQPVVNKKEVIKTTENKAEGGFSNLIFTITDNLELSLKRVLEKEHNEPSTHKKEKHYLSISSIAGDACLRKQYYALQNADLNDNYNMDKHLIMGFGTLLHEMVQKPLEKHGVLQYVEKFLIDHDLKVCGSTDGYLHEDNTIVDFKSCGLSMYNYVLRSGKAKKAHIAQAHWYAYMLSKILNKPITTIKIAYFNKNQGGYCPFFSKAESNITKVLEYLEATASKMSSINDEHPLKYNIENLKQSLFDLKSIKEREENAYGKPIMLEIDVPYDEAIMQEEIEKVKKFWAMLEYNKNIPKDDKGVLKKKEKLPAKISKPLYCKGCQYLLTCRGQEWIDKNVTNS